MLIESKNYDALRHIYANSLDLELENDEVSVLTEMVDTIPKRGGRGKGKKNKNTTEKKGEENKEDESEDEDMGPPSPKHTVASSINTGKEQEESGTHSHTTQAKGAPVQEGEESHN